MQQPEIPIAVLPVDFVDEEEEDSANELTREPSGGRPEGLMSPRMTARINLTIIKEDPDEWEDQQQTDAETLNWLTK